MATGAQKFAVDVRQSRVFYRRNLAKEFAIVILTKHEDGGRYTFQDPAQFVEDFANAVMERLAAREEQELAGVPK